ncbi:conserved hypothetical protein [Paraburkholderia piptadeniae]|uniref:DUF3717 domain-containing protein n=3 Tax=Burkholderiaceae TaxID=119060 RepID=A0A7X1NHJ9_9BURK|nr:DUF3717 domain-containing protein [Paraburkholderia franconis]SIT51850.1 conserved hypothetical protein [Paraburkholderia piptadeniae]
MNIGMSDIEAAIGHWRRASASEEAFAASSEGRALARLYGAAIAQGSARIEEGELDEAERAALRLLRFSRTARATEKEA